MAENDNESNTAPVGRVPSRGAADTMPAPAGSGDPAYNPEPPPRRLRRFHRVWPDRDGNISYLLTLCVEGRARVLDNAETFQRLTAFLLDSPTRYRWFPRRFVVMPDHLHLIAHQGHEAVRLGQWIKALKVVVAGLERRDDRPVETGARPGDAPTRPVRALQEDASRPVGRVPSPGDLAVPSPGAGAATHEFTRLKRAWRWQAGFHDHKFRTPESEQRKWEYVCLNPVRSRMVERPEHWLFGGEVFYDEAGGPRLVPGTHRCWKRECWWGKMKIRRLRAAGLQHERTSSKRKPVAYYRRCCRPRALTRRRAQHALTRRVRGPGLQGE